MVLRASLRLFGLVRRAAASPRQEPASWLLIAGNAACSQGGKNTFIFTRASSITSESFLKRLAKGKETVEDDCFNPHLVPVPSDSAEQVNLLLRHPDQPDNSKVLKVAIIGSTNAGKSTLSNQLLGRKVFAVSKKVHMTRSRALGVITEDDTQIILLDTPGLASQMKIKRHNLEKSVIMDPWNTVKEADLLLVMVDVADKRMCQRLDFEVLKCLAQHPDIPSVLVLNKVDLMKVKEKLLYVTAELTCGMVNGKKMPIRRVIKPPWAEKRPEHDSELLLRENSTDTRCTLSIEQLKELRSQNGWPRFKDVFMISSVVREDVETLKTYLMVAAKPGPWQYHSGVVTDQSPESICTNIIREKLMEYLPLEVPYRLTQNIELWRDGENGCLDINVKIYAMKDAHMKMLIGVAGQTVARIAREAGEDLSRIFLREVKLFLAIKMRN